MGVFFFFFETEIKRAYSEREKERPARSPEIRETKKIEGVDRGKQEKRNREKEGEREKNRKRKERERERNKARFVQTKK